MNRLVLKAVIPYLSVLLLALASFSPEAEGVNIGIVFDGPSDLNAKALTAYKKEISDLTEGEFTVRFPENKIITADWTTAGVAAAINRELTDPGVDIVITLGVIGSAEAAIKSALPKPVIAPWVIDPELLGLKPSKGGGSGVRNLYYLSRPKVLGKDIKKFRQIVGFHKMTILYMPFLKDLLPGIENSVRRIGAEEDVVITLVPVKPSVAETLASIPPDAQAVYITPLLNYTDADKAELYDGLIEKKLPSFSMLGKGEVDIGALVGLAPDHDFTREARRVALVVQSILLGNAAGDYPVDFSEEELLTINMATAHAINFSPSWSVLTEAALINEEPAQKGRTLTLEQAVNESVEVNLDLLAANQTVAAGAQDIKLAMSQLLP
ncbi:MAG TPA: hypothetical protein VHC46_02215, partial [Thermodesulfobacteriota bacterium]|nr:hypothetical protein [Thermodesulfobacteriota bacterium]